MTVGEGRVKVKKANYYDETSSFSGSFSSFSHCVNLQPNTNKEVVSGSDASSLRLSGAWREQAWVLGVEKLDQQGWFWVRPAGKVTK
jgi:hypothetical protein